MKTDIQLATLLFKIVRQREQQASAEVLRAHIALASANAKQQAYEEHRDPNDGVGGGFIADYSREIESARKTLEKAQEDDATANQLIEYVFHRILNEDERKQAAP